MAGLEPGEAGPVGAEGGRFSVSPVNGDRPGNLLMQKESSDMGRLVFHICNNNIVVVVS